MPTLCLVQSVECLLVSAILQNYATAFHQIVAWMVSMVQRLSVVTLQVHAILQNTVRVRVFPVLPTLCDPSTAYVMHQLVSVKAMHFATVLLQSVLQSSSTRRRLSVVLLWVTVTLQNTVRAQMQYVHQMLINYRRTHVVHLWVRVCQPPTVVERLRVARRFHIITRR